MALEIMECRYDVLKALIEGYKRTGIPLIAYQDNQLQVPATADDYGLYCIIPQIVTYFNISLDSALQIFMHSITAFAFISAAIALCCTYTKWTERVISLLGLLLLSRISFPLVDIYKFTLTTTVAIIPWSLYFLKAKKSLYGYMLFAFGAGFFISFAQYFRAYSGGAAFLFFIITLFGNSYFSTKNKLYLCAVLCMGMYVPKLYFDHLFNIQKNYVTTHLPNARIENHQHVLWHQLYIGLGFLTNNLGISYDDKIAFDKVESISPNTPACSPISESILKNEVIHVVKHHALFVMYTVWAKIGVLLLYLLIFANIGLLAAFFYPKGWLTEGAFIAALGFSSLFGLIAVPAQLYLLGYIACSTLYGIVSVNHALERGALNRIFRQFSHLYNSYIKS